MYRKPLHYEGSAFLRIIPQLFHLTCHLVNYFLANRQLCTGEAGVGTVYRKPLHYKGSAFHRIIPQVSSQLPSFTRAEANGGGRAFLDRRCCRIMV